MSRNLLRRSRTRSITHLYSANIEALERRVLLSGSTDPITVLIGGAAAKAVQFTDVGGTKATIQVTGGGNATVIFNGDNLSQGVGPAAIVVSGANVTLASIALANTGLNSILSITTRGRGAITSGPISSTGVMASIIAPTVVVNGDITTAGWVHQIQLAGAENGTINIGPSHINGGLILSLGSADNESLISAIRISTLSSVQWLNTNNVSEMIQAPQLMTTNVSGAFAPDISLPGVAGATSAIGSFTAGAISSGTWAITGNVQRIAAGSVASGWTADISGTLNILNITHDAQIDLTASTVGSMIVHGSLSNSTITLNQPLAPAGNDLNTLMVGGSIESTILRANGNIGSITATSILNSTIFAGIITLPGGQTLPQQPTDFGNVAQINSITLRRTASASFSNSDIAAYALGRIVLDVVATSNGGTPFGLAAHSLRFISLTDQTTGKSAQIANVPSSLAFEDILISKGITQGDLVLNIV
jgi:hypothetical protein